MPNWWRRGLGTCAPIISFSWASCFLYSSSVERSIKHVELEIEQRLHPEEERLARMEKITGVSRHTFHLLCAEVGLDLSRFPDAAHLASWAGICPGHKQSAGKRKTRADASSQCVCEDGTGSSGAYHGSDPDVSGRAVSTLAQTAGGQTSSSGSRT